VAPAVPSQEQDRTFGQQFLDGLAQVEGEVFEFLVKVFCENSACDVLHTQHAVQAD
jgi:hypothetical protein